MWPRDLIFNNSNLIFIAHNNSKNINISGLDEKYDASWNQTQTEEL